MRTLTLILVCASVAQAQHCYKPSYVQQNYAQQVQVLGVTVPLYGAVYTGENYVQQSDILLQLLEEIRGLRADVADLRSGGTVTAQDKKQDVFALFKDSCVSCHSGAKPKGEFALVGSDGKYLKLSPADRRSVVERVERVGAGQMPPLGKDAAGKQRRELSPADKAAIKAALTDAPPAKK